METVVCGSSQQTIVVLCYFFVSGIVAGILPLVTGVVTGILRLFSRDRSGTIFRRFHFIRSIAVSRAWQVEHRAQIFLIFKKVGVKLHYISL